MFYKLTPEMEKKIIESYKESDSTAFPKAFNVSLKAPDNGVMNEEEIAKMPNPFKNKWEAEH